MTTSTLPLTNPSSSSLSLLDHVVNENDLLSGNLPNVPIAPTPGFSSPLQSILNDHSPLDFIGSDFEKSFLKLNQNAITRIPGMNDKDPTVHISPVECPLPPNGGLYPALAPTYLFKKEIGGEVKYYKMKDEKNKEIEVKNFFEDPLYQFRWEQFRIRMVGDMSPLGTRCGLPYLSAGWIRDREVAPLGAENGAVHGLQVCNSKECSEDIDKGYVQKASRSSTNALMGNLNKITRNNGYVTYVRGQRRRIKGVAGLVSLNADDYVENAEQLVEKRRMAIDICKKHGVIEGDLTNHFFRTLDNEDEYEDWLNKISEEDHGKFIRNSMDMSKQSLHFHFTGWAYDPIFTGDYRCEICGHRSSNDKKCCGRGPVLDPCNYVLKFTLKDKNNSYHIPVKNSRSEIKKLTSIFRKIMTYNLNHAGYIGNGQCHVRFGNRDYASSEYDKRPSQQLMFEDPDNEGVFYTNQIDLPCDVVDEIREMIVDGIDLPSEGGFMGRIDTNFYNSSGVDTRYDDYWGEQWDACLLSWEKYHNLKGKSSKKLKDDHYSIFTYAPGEDPFLSGTWDPINMVYTSFDGLLDPDGFEKDISIHIHNKNNKDFQYTLSEILRAGIEILNVNKPGDIFNFLYPTYLLNTGRRDTCILRPGKALIQGWHYGLTYHVSEDKLLSGDPLGFGYTIIDPEIRVGYINNFIRRLKT